MVILMKYMSEENFASRLEKFLIKEKEYVFDFSDTNFTDETIYDFFYRIKKNVNCKFWYRGLSFHQAGIIRKAIHDVIDEKKK